MINGTVNRNLVPIVPVKVKRLDGNWQKLGMLLDTGFEDRLLVAMNAVMQHNISVWPPYNPTNLEYYSQLGGRSEFKLECKVELLLRRNQRVDEAEIINMHDFPGVIGVGLLLRQRITIDVIENGAVGIDHIPPPTRTGRIRRLFRRPKRQRPYSDCPPLFSTLPWAEVAVRDREGTYHTLCANVDTGDNGELTLPLDEVERLGLRLNENSWVSTMNGPAHASCGEIGIIWQGETRTVQCRQRSDVDRPIIGMKLLSGNRITMDIGYPTKIVDIAPIP